MAAPETDANSYGIQADMRLPVHYGGAWFWEPLGTIAWLRTSIDDRTRCSVRTSRWGHDQHTRQLGGRVGVVNYWGGYEG